MRSLLRRMNRTDPSDEAFSIGGQRKELKKVHDAGGIPDINFFSRGTAVQNQVDLNAATYGGTNPVQVNHVTATSVGVDINGSELLVPAMRRGTTSTKNLFLNTPRAMIEQKEVAAVPGTNRIDAAHVDMAHVFRNSIPAAPGGGAADLYSGIRDAIAPLNPMNDDAIGSLTEQRTFAALTALYLRLGEVMRDIDSNKNSLDALESGSDERAEVAELFTELNEEKSEITNLLVSASRMISTYFEIGVFIANPQELRDLVEASAFHKDETLRVINWIKRGRNGHFTHVMDHLMTKEDQLKEQGAAMVPVPKNPRSIDDINTYASKLYAYYESQGKIFDGMPPRTRKAAMGEFLRELIGQMKKAPDISLNHIGNSFDGHHSQTPQTLTPTAAEIDNATINSIADVLTRLEFWVKEFVTRNKKDMYEARNAEALCKTHGVSKEAHEFYKYTSFGGAGEGKLQALNYKLAAAADRKNVEKLLSGAISIAAVDLAGVQPGNGNGGGTQDFGPPATTDDLDWNFTNFPSENKDKLRKHWENILVKDPVELSYHVSMQQLSQAMKGRFDVKNLMNDLVARKNGKPRVDKETQREFNAMMKSKTRPPFKQGAGNKFDKKARNLQSRADRKRKKEQEQEIAAARVQELETKVEEMKQATAAAVEQATAVAVKKALEDAGIDQAALQVDPGYSNGASLNDLAHRDKRPKIGAVDVDVNAWPEIDTGNVTSLGDLATLQEDEAIMSVGAKWSDIEPTGSSAPGWSANELGDDDPLANVHPPGTIYDYGKSPAWLSTPMIDSGASLPNCTSGDIHDGDEAAKNRLGRPLNYSRRLLDSLAGAVLASAAGLVIQPVGKEVVRIIHEHPVTTGIMSAGVLLMFIVWLLGASLGSMTSATSSLWSGPRFKANAFEQVLSRPSSYPTPPKATAEAHAIDYEDLRRVQEEIEVSMGLTVATLDADDDDPVVAAAAEMVPGENRLREILDMSEQPILWTEDFNVGRPLVDVYDAHGQPIKQLMGDCGASLGGTMSEKDMQEFVKRGMGHWFIRHVGEKKTVRTLSVSKSQPCLIGLFGVRLTFKVVPQKFAPWKKKPWPENVMEKESRYVTIDTVFHVLDVMSGPPLMGCPYMARNCMVPQMIMQEGKLFCALSLKYNALLHDNAPGAVVTYFLNGARPSNLKFFNIASSKQMVERVPSRNVPSAIHNNSASAVDQDLREAQALLSAKESEESPAKRLKVTWKSVFERT